MFSTKGLFSQVPCPHLGSCLLPGCIFAHPQHGFKPTDATEATQSGNHLSFAHNKDAKRPSTTDALPSGTPLSFAGAEEDVSLTDAAEAINSSNQSNLAQEVSRKRRKIDSANLTSDSAGSTGPSTDREKTETFCSSSGPQRSSESLSSSRKLEQTADKVFPTTREISPPPLRRTSQAQSSTGTADNGQSTTPLRTRPLLSGSNTPLKPATKQESLNPRALKTQAPASHDMRHKLLKALHEQLNRLNSELSKDAGGDDKKLVLSEQELIKKALDIEEDATLTPAIYSNVVKNKILVYKRMTVSQWRENIGRELAKAKAAEAASLSDTPLSKPAEPPKPIETGLSSEEEVKLVSRLLTPVTGLSKHGYVNAVPSEQEIDQARQGVEAAKGWEVCDRCKARFQVFPGRREEDGVLSSGGPCTHHFGKPYWPERSALDPKAKREKKYRCCGQAIGDSTGCTKSDNHVFKISEVKRMAAVLNFQETPDNPGKQSAWPVCIDGEMGYTVYGLELIRLTATSWPLGDELFDVLVKPVGEILDLNSRYSGVWPKDMAEALPWAAQPHGSGAGMSTNAKRMLRMVDSPAAARALLFSHISPETPIIGHGLENDLNATRIIHPTLIDTALLFPHKAGLPYRNGLKMLMHTHLNRHIQIVVDGKMEGHDSKEDANAAGDLVRFALGNEWRKMQKDGWKLENGEFKAPLPKGPPVTPAQEAGDGDSGQSSVSGKKRPRYEMEIEEGEVA